jgi:hypothetical protein
VCHVRPHHFLEQSPGLIWRLGGMDVVGSHQFWPSSHQFRVRMLVFRLEPSPGLEKNMAGEDLSGQIQDMSDHF